MERRKRLFSWFVWCVCICTYLTACMTREPVLVNTGASSEQLSDAADKQASATAKIDTEATKIEIKTNEPDSKDSAIKIKDANKDLKENIAVLKTEAASKDEYLKRYEDLLKDYKNLEDKYNSSFRTITYWLYGIGALLFAGGMFLAIKSAGEFWYAPLVGVCLIVAAVGAKWVEDNIGTIIGAVVSVVVLMGIRMWMIHDGIIHKSVKVAERMKDYIPESVRTELFGTREIPGKVSLEQNDVEKKYIARTRKSIHKEWDPVGSPKK